MAHHSIRNGLDIPIAGVATGEVVTLDAPSTVSIDPREFRGFVPRLAAREGETVRKGQPILFHKFDPDVKIVAPVAGRIQAVQRGDRRVIKSVVIEIDGDETIEHRAWTLDELKSIPSDQAMQQLLAGGAFPLLRTRPLDHVPDPKVKPQAILISATESGPLMPGADVLMSADDKSALQAAVYVLNALTDGPVHFTTASGASHPAWDGLQGVENHTVDGPHPSGDPGVQVNLIDPPRGAQKVWYLRAWDAVALGNLFLKGFTDSERVYAAVGAGLSAPRYVRTLLGAPMSHIAGDAKAGPMRWIRGSILTGTQCDPGTGAGWFSRGVHVVADDVPTSVLGWAAPMFSKWSFSKTFLAGFSKASKRFDLRPGLYGGHRAIVPVGIYRTVVATPNIEPSFLFKSVIAGDLEASIELGMLDITMEEAALCSFVCPSKIDFDVILSEGLDRYAKEA